MGVAGLMFEPHPPKFEKLHNLGYGTLVGFKIPDEIQGKIDFSQCLI